DGGLVQRDSGLLDRRREPEFGAPRDRWQRAAPRLPRGIVEVGRLRAEALLARAVRVHLELRRRWRWVALADVEEPRPVLPPARLGSDRAVEPSVVERARETAKVPTARVHYEDVLPAGDTETTRVLGERAEARKGDPATVRRPHRRGGADLCDD